MRTRAHSRALSLSSRFGACPHTRALSPTSQRPYDRLNVLGERKPSGDATATVLAPAVRWGGRGAFKSALWAVEPVFPTGDAASALPGGHSTLVRLRLATGGPDARGARRSRCRARRDERGAQRCAVGAVRGRCILRHGDHSTRAARCAPDNRASTPGGCAAAIPRGAEPPPPRAAGRGGAARADLEKLRELSASSSRRAVPARTASGARAQTLAALGAPGGAADGGVDGGVKPRRRRVEPARRLAERELGGARSRALALAEALVGVGRVAAPKVPRVVAPARGHSLVPPRRARRAAVVLSARAGDRVVAHRAAHSRPSRARRTTTTTTTTTRATRARRTTARSPTSRAAPAPSSAARRRRAAAREASASRPPPPLPGSGSTAEARAAPVAPARRRAHARDARATATSRSETRPTVEHGRIAQG